MKVAIVIEIIKALPSIASFVATFISEWREKKDKLELREEIKELKNAVKSHDANRINELFNKLHNKTKVD